MSTSRTLPTISVYRRADSPKPPILKDQRHNYIGSFWEERQRIKAAQRSHTRLPGACCTLFQTSSPPPTHHNITSSLTSVKTTRKKAENNLNSSLSSTFPQAVSLISRKGIVHPIIKILSIFIRPHVYRLFLLWNEKKIFGEMSLWVFYVHTRKVKGSQCDNQPSLKYLL